ncbi:potassium channel family protein [Rubellimicrobium aerolatum]|uniref:Potassium channel family protein n=1 Tax=Rubellimicrobium aerolatum TaxID=490979 RepID=A0ABW0S943_9RHOB|nr:potassium channel family protein [Rubellimicrobium aerolatum]MBP1804818.1 voltage-gated potassium channel [Rubellimicrobium aerolatum]
MIPFLRELYEGHSDRAHRFRTALLAFDLLTLVFIIATSFIPRPPWVEAVDVLLGILIAGDLAARLAICPRKTREFLRLSTWTDIIAILSFLAPLTSEGAGFLRVLRTLRILKTYTTLNAARDRNGPLTRNEEVILAIANLGVFIFIMTAIVYETQHRRNEEIGNYADALYFTVTALTTTGFGDITLPGTTGRMLTVIIMIFGVTLFLRLAQVLFRPHKVRFPCPVCGLQRHDPDAVHCKACGTLLNIPDEGD